ncbi:MAG: hypothetical protein WAV56_02210 [Microgenomates group bacterium]
MATRVEQILAKAGQIKQVGVVLMEERRKEEEIKQAEENVKKAQSEIEDVQRKRDDENRLRSTGVISIFEEIRNDKILLFRKGVKKYEKEILLQDDPDQGFLERLINGPRRREIVKRVEKGCYDEPAHLIAEGKRACLIFDYWFEEGDDWGKCNTCGSKCLFAEIDEGEKLYLWFRHTNGGGFPPDGYWLGGHYAKGVESVPGSLDEKIAEILSQFLK